METHSSGQCAVPTELKPEENVATVQSTVPAVLV